MEHLYVANSNRPGGLLRYRLPLSPSSTPDVTIVTANEILAVGVDASGTVVAGDGFGNLMVYSAPLTSASTPFATFRNGSGSNDGDVAFTSSGSFFASTLDPSGVNLFTPPFTNASTPAMTIARLAIGNADGLELDAAQNLYVTNAGSGEIFVFAPPYSGSPTVARSLTALYHGLEIRGPLLFVASITPVPGKVDVYALPLTTTSVPAFSITTGMNLPEAVAFDSAGNLYVGNFRSANVKVYAPPFSAASAPFLTLTLSPPINVFEIAIGK